jgi:alpha-amylase/alpha-mannosidase (GH57 family)
MSAHSVIIHQHLYQPPREDPWFEVVDTERSAAPDHDWNTRITRECYARQASAEAYRLTARDAVPSPSDPDAKAGLARLVNLYAWCSFDVGATLCEWLDTEAPHVLAAMQAGDAASVARWGHGNAIAAPYHHVILPLSSPRDRITEIRWGIRDFTRRFGRAPEGFWFPECAVDEETLEAAAAEGIRYTVLAPYQVQGHDGGGMPVRWRGASGRELIIVPYDGALAGDVAFGGLLRDSGALAGRLTPYRDQELSSARCTTLATDGETFGHHHHGGDSTLAEALSLVARRTNSQLTNLGALVARHAPQADVSIVAPSAWSCSHGVERWRSNCGCRIDGGKPPAQQWRGPLRQAMQQLAAKSHEVFASEGASLFADDPWAVRDAYGEVVAFDGDILTGFVDRHVREGVGPAERQRAAELLELARASLRTFTSCAWFFDEVDRIEVRQILGYVARCVELSGAAARITPDLLQWLSLATNGSPGAISAADVFVRDVMPHVAPELRAGAGAMALAAAGLDARSIGAFDVHIESREPLWQVEVTHRRTARRTVVSGSLSGAGASLRVRTGLRESDPGTWVDLFVHDLPETVARALLLVRATDDDTLLDDPLGKKGN